MVDRPPRTNAGSFLTKKYGPLPGWQWAGLIGGGLAIVFYIRRGASSSSSTSNLTPAGQGQIDPATGLPYASEYGPAGGGQVLAPIIIQQGPPSGPGTKGGPPVVKPPKVKQPTPPGRKPTKPPTSPGTRINASDFPTIVNGLSAQGKSMVTVGTVQNHRIVGGNVANTGAPVYALVKSPYGPLYKQGFNLAQLPNGTKITTLPQFKGDIRKTKASR